MRLLKNYKLKPEARIFELGAHQCIVAMMLANIVGPKGEVIALEASKHNYNVALKNILINRIKNIKIIHSAASNVDGQLIFNETLNGQVDDGGAAECCVRVNALSVDTLSKRFGTPDVLWVDVEGYECQVLEGARDTLSTCPDCFIEVHVGVGLEKFHGSVQQIVNYFPSNKYSRFK